MKSAVMHEQATTHSVHLQWPEMADAELYMIRYREVMDTAARRLDGHESEWKTIKDITTNEFNLDGLDQGKKYEVQIMGYNEDKMGDWSDPIMVSTVVTSIPEKVAEFHVRSRDAKSMTVAWKSVVNDETYSVCHQKEGDDEICKTTGNDEYEITGLVPHTKYTVSITGMNAQQQRGPVASIIEKTNKNSVVVTTPEDIEEGRIGPTSIEVTYSDVEDATYRVCLYDTAARSHVCENTADDSHRFTNLPINHNYKAYVSAVVDSNESAASKLIEVSTMNKATAPFKPSGIKVSTVTEGSVEVTFEAPADNGGDAVMKYTAYFREKGVDNWKSAAGTGSSVTVDGLKANTEYEIQATASNIRGESSRTSTETASTLQAGAETKDNT